MPGQNSKMTFTQSDCRFEVAFVEASIAKFRGEPVISEARSCRVGLQVLSSFVQHEIA